ncbi:hypothetical protein HYPSUDRAFT_44481 [Hypholoma sublateritium FD-334 SS-4]|uniref:Cytochrome P450 n=1 Tax=Hypholoma sublateritium (strain FD-334 SS-4) TaxID=945553 RepID=A0A0D2KXG5_HYPSF|nr:hypothetical protein HYPSUDRAFT_44481 [Hypholoma sublateritium FD-334 SS-4]
MALPSLAVSALTTLGCYVFYQVSRFFITLWTSPLRTLRGPPNPSLLFGNMGPIQKSENAGLHEQWTAEYGHTFTYKMMFLEDRLYTTDTKALNHILMNSYIYQKPAASKYNLTRIVGGGVLVAEEDVHKQQRRIMNPAFGASQIRELTEIFVEKSIQLRDIWAMESSKEGSNGHVEVLSWLSKMTLDVIGQAGFNYRFDALSGKTSELSEAFSAIFESATTASIVMLLRGMIPALRFLPDPRDGKIKEAHQTMNQIGQQLMQESKADVTNGKTSWTRRDLLSLLLRANVSGDLPPTQRMTDADVLSQVPTFLVAGHETTSTGTTWALFALTQNQEAQRKLRQELLAVGTDNPTMDELNALPYLDAVVRESLRVHSPVLATTREAAQDDFLPFSEPLMDKHGKMINGLQIKKGQTILVPIQSMNRIKSIWGEDATEFKPERWEKVPEAASSIPGVWGNMMTFLGGPRACIGYRFSLVEMKVLLFTLVRAFEFELAVPASEIGKKSFIVQRPLLRSNPKAGNQMPLILKPVVQA